MAQSDFVLVAVHGGAGYHSHESETEVRKALRVACKRVLDRLQDSCTALNAVEDSIVALEDDQYLNSGFGSNLTVDGAVECDASITDGRTGNFGSVGAVSGVKNPIRAARAVLEHSTEPDPLGRIRPTLLVSNGAHAFAESRGITCVPPDSLISDRARSEWQLWKARLDAALHVEGSLPDTRDLHKLQDTVGAIAWDRTACLAAGVSSGGLLLKYPGRVGEAAVYGAGCWARQGVHGPGAACSVSGSGEYIVREMLARSVCEDCLGDPEGDTHEVLRRRLTEFYDHSRARGEPEPLAGVLLLVQEVDDEGAIHARLWCGFTSQSMAIAYASSLDPKPKAMILRREPSRGTTSPIYITALSLRR